MDYNLMCYGNYDEQNPRCGMCRDNKGCEWETKWNNADVGESKNGNNRRHKK